LTTQTQIQADVTDGPALTDSSDQVYSEDVAVSSKPIQFEETDLREFTGKVYERVRSRDFRGLDEMAAEYRQRKERFTQGGGWKIHSFYLLASAPSGDLSDEGWIAHIKFLEDWKEAMPTSIAARTSLAGAYISFAWKVRGDGFANEVPKANFAIFDERLDRAIVELNDASKLEQKCYGYYEVLLNPAVAGRMGSEKPEKVFEEALAFDPEYQYFYTMKALDLTTRWHGKAGEVASFADSLLKTRGEREGLKLYYLIVAELAELKWENDLFVSNKLSWKKAKKGYTIFEEDHGMSKLRINEFARLSIRARDAQAACNTFKRLNGVNDFAPGIWRDMALYAQERKMALEVWCKVPRFGNQAE
jgi:hypothetical protein